MMLRINTLSSKSCESAKAKNLHNQIALRTKQQLPHDRKTYTIKSHGEHGSIFHTMEILAQSNLTDLHSSNVTHNVPRSHEVEAFYIARRQSDERHQA